LRFDRIFFKYDYLIPPLIFFEIEEYYLLFRKATPFLGDGVTFW